MRTGRAALVAGLLLMGAVPAHAWMTFVARDVATGARIGKGARVALEKQDPALSIACMPDGLTATFETGLPITAETKLADMSVPISVAADGGEYDPIPTTAESFDSGSGPTIRLRLSADEAMGLVEYVLGAETSIQVSYRVGTEELAHASFPNDSAPISIGAVLSECEER
ncbi:hypothetical protein [Devosia sp. SL43]|uniref:hypothetical protein n=1 Tax=Devosia sp. SL43 TaxID=2806348 RepID=UPI001F1EABD0|nr:hypothetical protein [Devosia sp. SL43]UJW84571.1 hypothetical protein IM737_14215 [Devosia sp. SL43]